METDINTIIGAIIENMTADGRDADVEAVIEYRAVFGSSHKIFLSRRQ